MKYLGITFGWLCEEFVPWPSCGIRKMTLTDGTYYDVMFSLWFWYFTVGQISKKLKENGYFDLTKKDLCKTCKHYWTDFSLPLDHVVSHCEILDDKKGLSANMDNEVPYPCLECPFKCYVKK